MRRTLATLVFLVTLAPVAFGQPYPISMRREFPTVPDPTAVVLADFNRDGNLDLAVTSGPVDSLSVRLGNGKGFFAPRVDYPAGDEPVAMVAGDLNGDGIAELVVVNRAAGTLSVFPGASHGAFRARVDFPVGTDPRGVALGDVTGDTRPDAVVANFGSNSVTVLAGGDAANGLTGEAFQVTTGSGPRGVALADLNRDGVLDFVTTNASVDSISTRMSTYGGTFGTRADVHVPGGAPIAIALGDLNNDGNLDAVTANQTAGTITYLVGNALGQFNIASQVPADPGPSALLLADVTHDGAADITVVHDGSNLLTTIRNNGSGGLLTKQSTTLGSANAVAIAAGDLDGDGRRDLVIPTQAPDTVRVIFTADPAGAFGGKVAYASGNEPWGVTTGDFDGNGTPDVALANRLTDNISVYLNAKGDGVLTGPVFHPAGNSPLSIVAGHLNGDGRADLVVGCSSTFEPDTNRVQVLVNDGLGGFLPPVSYDAGMYARHQVALGDLTGDDNLDVVVARGFTGTLSLIPGTGLGTLDTVTTFPVGSFPQAVHLRDVDENGLLDLIFGDLDTPGTLSVMLGNGDGSFGSRTDIVVGQGTRDITSGDFNGDGNVDLVTPYQTGQQFAFLAGNGSGGFAALLPSTHIGGQTTSLDAGDLNEDGLDDVAIGSGGNFVVVAYAQGGGTFGPGVGSLIGNTQQDVRLVDLDGNGTLDVVAANVAPPYSLGVAFGRMKTRTALAVTPESSPVGATITYTATMTRTKPDDIPITGSVRFLDGLRVLATQSVTDGVATFMQAGTQTWQRTITAEYLGDGYYLGSISPSVPHVTFTPAVGVEPPPAALAVALARNPVVDGVLRVRVALASPFEAAELALVDVRGRVVERRAVGAGEHAFQFARGLAPGVYHVRLVQGSRVAVARAVVL